MAQFSSSTWFILLRMTRFKDHPLLELFNADDFEENIHYEDDRMYHIFNLDVFTSLIILG